MVTVNFTPNTLYLEVGLNWGSALWDVEMMSYKKLQIVSLRDFDHFLRLY
jgi:hypothetical protein